MSSKPHRSIGRKPRKGWRNAKNSDPNELYELSVQDPLNEIDFLRQVWKDIRGPRRKCVDLREDFSGTGAMSAAWVQAGPKNRSWGVDLDPAVQAWAKANHVDGLTDAQKKRITFLNGDVRTTKTPPVDTVLALNFSYFVFKTRPELLTYYKSVHKHLRSDGIFILDAYGGSDTWLELEEERNMDGFTYVWDQRVVNPVTNEVLNHIHFRFPDGSQIKKAFSYDWRLWTLAEIREALLEAGFKSVDVYWEGTNNKTGEGNGVFKPTLRGEACQAWIAYMAAAK